VRLLERLAELLEYEQRLPVGLQVHWQRRQRTLEHDVGCASMLIDPMLHLLEPFRSVINRALSLRNEMRHLLLVRSTQRQCVLPTVRLVFGAQATSVWLGLLWHILLQEAHR
jgi:hypothetical protein